MLENIEQNTVIHCKTKEEALEVLKIAHEEGYIWKDGKHYIDQDRWSKYGDQTCYRLKAGVFSDLEYYTENGNTIVSAYDFLTTSNSMITRHKLSCGELYTSKSDPFNLVVMCTCETEFTSIIADKVKFNGICLRCPEQTEAIRIGMPTTWLYADFELITDMEIALKIKQ